MFLLGFFCGVIGVGSVLFVAGLCGLNDLEDDAAEHAQ